jgi:hypothetical protein
MQTHIYTYIHTYTCVLHAEAAASFSFTGGRESATLITNGFSSVRMCIYLYIYIYIYIYTHTHKGCRKFSDHR